MVLALEHSVWGVWSKDWSPSTPCYMEGARRGATDQGESVYIHFMEGEGLQIGVSQCTYILWRERGYRSGWVSVRTFSGGWGVTDQGESVYVHFMEGEGLQIRVSQLYVHFMEGEGLQIRVSHTCIFWRVRGYRLGWVCIKVHFVEGVEVTVWYGIALYTVGSHWSKLHCAISEHLSASTSRRNQLLSVTCIVSIAYRSTMWTAKWVWQ